MISDPAAAQPPEFEMIPTRRDLSSLLALAVPVVGVQVGLMSMGVVDTVMVGRVSAVDLAAVAIGNLYFWIASAFGMGTLMALDPVVAQAVGAGDDLSVSRAVQRGFVMAGILAVVGGLFLIPGEFLLTLARQPAEVVPVAAGYARVSIPGVFPFFVFIVLRQTLQALGKMRPILITILVANLLNGFLNWILVWGNGGAPAMGALGSGIASSISRWFMALGLLAISWPLMGGYLRTFRPRALTLAPLVRMFRLGLPIGIQFELEFGVFATTALFMGLLGTIPVAGHQVAINLASLTFMVPLGIGQATSVLVGRAIGARDPSGSRRAAGAGILAGTGFMVITALVLILAPALLASGYTSDPAVLAVAVTLIPLAGLFQVFDGIQVVAAGVLRGVGDTRFPMFINLVGFWALGLPIGLGLGFGVGMGPRGLWFGLVAGLAAVAVLLLWRVHVRMGGDLERVVVDSDERPGN